jgi:hypothetical protein
MNIKSRIPIEGTYDIANIATDSDEIKTLNTDLIYQQQLEIS